MKFASYRGTRSGIAGIGNIAIRSRLRGPFSHTEIVFMPGDGVDELMPDGTCEPDADGALWCASSASFERMPTWSRRRAGRLGGVRMKRIVLNDKWVLDDLPGQDARAAATWARENEGMLYDWQLILGFVAWIIPQKESRAMCTEACLRMLGVNEAWRFDPCSGRQLVLLLNSMFWNLTQALAHKQGR